MSRILSLTLAGAVLSLGGIDAAIAQGPSLTRPRVRPYERPTTSPYLNLLQNNGRGVGFNYFRFVRPEVEFRQADSQFRRDQIDLQRQINQNRRDLQNQADAEQAAQSQLSPSGRAASFMTHQRYFGIAAGR